MQLLECGSDSSNINCIMKFSGVKTVRCRKLGPPKHWCPTTTLHGVTTQKIWLET